MPTFLAGHGKWHLEDGFARVPANTEITFYTNNAKTLWNAEAIKILDGTTQFPLGQLDVYTAGQSVPNMTLSDPEENRSKFELAAQRRTDAYKLIMSDPGKPQKLADLMIMFQGEKLVWVACRAVDLNKVMGQGVAAGPRIGVNVRENPSTIYSAYICSNGQSPQPVDKGTFRGFMPPTWNLTKTPKTDS